MIFNEIQFSTPIGAQTVLNHLKDFIEDYSYVTVADLYSYIGYAIAPYHDPFNWGWDNLNNARIVCKCHNGCNKFHISFPPIKEVRKDHEQEWIFQ